MNTKQPARPGRRLLYRRQVPNDIAYAGFLQKRIIPAEEMRWIEARRRPAYKA